QYVEEKVKFREENYRICGYQVAPVCRVLQTLKRSIDVAFHSSNLHLK
ncbi:hypothetical protein K5549_019314, partial [Capra hircus]